MASSINSNDSASNNSTINDVPTTPWNRQEWMFPSYIQPVHILFGSAIPLCLGAYFGFTRQIRIYKKEAAAEAAAEAMNAVSNVVTTEGKILAGRALTIATMSSVGGFALTGAAIFYSCGFQSVDEAFLSFRSWGQRKRLEIEAASIDLGVDDHPDAIATKNMSEEEEMEYFEKKYMNDIEKRVSVWSWQRAKESK